VLKTATIYFLYSILEKEEGTVMETVLSDVCQPGFYSLHDLTYHSAFTCHSERSEEPTRDSSPTAQNDNEGLTVETVPANVAPRT